MILTYLFGIILLYQENYLIYENYFLIKLISVFFLTVFQFYLIYIYLKFKVRNNKKAKNFYKVLNEIHNLMIIIILLVVLKPNIG